MEFGAATYADWLNERSGGDDVDLLGEDLFRALQKCKIESICVSQEMSTNHLGGDDVVEFILATAKAAEMGLAITVWYGDAAEVLAAGYDPNELEVVEADYVNAGGEDDTDEDDDE